MLDLNDVAIFVQVVREGSFAAAGRRLGMPANTLSRRLQLLEAALGTQLLLRSTRKLSLTAAGRSFFEQSEQGIADIEEAHLALQEKRETPRGTVRVAAPADFFDHLGMDLLGEFMQRYPEIRLEFLLSDHRADLIAEGIDVAFRAGRLDDSSMVARKIADSALLLVASAGYLDRRGRPTRLADLAGHDCLVVASMGNRAVWRLAGPRGMEEIKVSGLLTCNTSKNILQAARAGMGIALLPSVVAGTDLALGRLQRVLPDYQQDLGGVHIVFPGRFRRAPAVNAWVDFVTEHMLYIEPAAAPRKSVG